MKKFYCFKQGQKLPSWMWRISHNDRLSKFENKGGKVVFGVSCIAIRETGKKTKLMPARVGDSVSYINISNFNNTEQGGVNRATGVSVITDDDNQKLHGLGIHYRVTNSKVKRLNYPTVEGF